MARSAVRPRARGRIEDHHAEWLSLVETSGPFLTVPALKRALPDGLEATTIMPDLRVAYAEWQSDAGLQRRWVRWVLDELLGLRDAVAEATDADPSHRVAEQAVTLRSSYVVRDRGQDGDPVVLLVHRYEQGTALSRPLPGERWAATPLDRAAELARAAGVPLALVTDGARWTLVWAREGESTGMCTWRSELWLEEPITLRAFVTLLGARRFFALPVEEGLAALLAESAGKQQEVADQLGAQVRRAVELLITTLDYEDRERHGELLAGLEQAEVYRGAVTVMMRLVFLFVAEERRLLPIDDPRYAETLAASTLRAQLQEHADREGEDPLERSTAAWHRILALFRAVHGGIEHDALRLPAYGGGLFDPDRYPFLEGRQPGSRWHEQAAHPLPVDDRTMLHLLDALQTLEQGGARVLLSYQALDVEQIGHVYEGLLDHTAVRTTDASLALGGKLEPELGLGELERWAAIGSDTLIERLAKETGRSPSAIGKALDSELSDEQRARLRAACGNDDALLDRVAPYHALLREDLRGDPLVILPGSLFVTQALDRRASGTYYTPRELAEEVVRHALDPVAYDPGPAQEPDPAKWKLKPAAELLELKIADIAMGSGAFLVAACRYLANRLLEAWKTEADPVDGAAAGLAGTGVGATLPADPIEREALAHRLVAERCLYGVDKNPMAVEMAKLSLWLITLAKDRPFSFVDHALRAGDSLLGVTDLKQLRIAHLDPSWHRQASLDLGFDEIEAAVDRALALRHELEAFVVRDVLDAERKAAMLAQADAALDDARLLGDLVVGAALAQLDDADPLASADVARNIRTMVDHEAPELERMVARTQLRALAETWLVETRRAVGEVPEVVWDDRHPFHWALEFPEVRERGGFDAIVGNPPFQGGKKISGALGGQYRDYLVEWLAGGARGSADLVAYFYLRASQSAPTERRLRADRDEHDRAGRHARGRARPARRRRAGRSTARSQASRGRAAPVWRWRRSGRGATAGADVACSTVPRSPGSRRRLTIRSRVTGNAHRLHANREPIVLRASSSSEWDSCCRPTRRRRCSTQTRETLRWFAHTSIGEDLNSAPGRLAVPVGHRLPRLAEERARDVRRSRSRGSSSSSGPSVRRVNREAHRRALVAVRRRAARALPRDRTARSLHRDHAVEQARPARRSCPTGHRAMSDMLVVFAYDDDAHFGLLSSGFHWWWAVTHASTHARRDSATRRPTASRPSPSPT